MALMRRSEAVQGVRLMRSLDILGRHKAASFHQVETEPLLHIHNHISTRQRFSTTAKPGFWIDRLAKRL